MKSNYFSTNIRKIRNDLNKNVAEFSKLIGINQSTIYRWENGEISPNIETAYMISEKLNVPIYDLLDKDLRYGTNNLDEFDILFSKYKEVLSEKDKEMIKFIIEQRKREIDEQNHNS